jgi:hypothetical protein
LFLGKPPREKRDMKNEASIEALFGYINSGSDYARKWYKKGEIKSALKMITEITAKAEELTARLEAELEDN